MRAILRYARRYPIGARIYEPGTHRYIGRVLAFESAHNFNNGLGPQPAVLIEPSEPVNAGKGGETWLGCDYMNNYEVKIGN